MLDIPKPQPPGCSKSYSHFWIVKKKSKKDIYRQFFQPYALNFDAKKSRSYLIEKYGDQFVISDEAFIGNTFNFGLNGYITKEHALRIKDTFPTAKIILFIRNQPDIIASTYCQYIAGGGTYSFHSYINRDGYARDTGLGLFSYDFYEYDRTLGLYYELFGKRNVSIYLMKTLRNLLKNLRVI